MKVYDSNSFLGLDCKANNTNVSQIDFGVFFDLEETSQIYTLSVSRHIGDRAQIETNANHVLADSIFEPPSNVEGIRYTEFKLSTFF